MQHPCTRCDDLGRAGMCCAALLALTHTHRALDPYSIFREIKPTSLFSAARAVVAGAALLISHDPPPPPSLPPSLPSLLLHERAALPRRARHFWIEGDLGNCDWELEDFKACFWLRVNEKEAEAFESKVRRVRQLEKPPPPSANGTVWPARKRPPAGWAHPGSGIPDDDNDAVLFSGAGDTVSKGVPPPKPINHGKKNGGVLAGEDVVGSDSASGWWPGA
jgi:hypothetical protein